MNIWLVIFGMVGLGIVHYIESSIDETLIAPLIYLSIGLIVVGVLV